MASFKITCTDSTEILFSKIRSAGLNYHLPKRKFFTFPYCAGVSNKHCLLTFFSFLIGSYSFFQVTRIVIKVRMSLNFK